LAVSSRQLAVTANCPLQTANCKLQTVHPSKEAADKRRKKIKPNNQPQMNAD
jgi:hypothetical protein